MTAPTREGNLRTTDSGDRDSSIRALAGENGRPDFGLTVADAMALSKRAARVMVGIPSLGLSGTTNMVLSPQAFRKGVQFRDADDSLPARIETFAGDEPWLVVGDGIAVKHARAALAKAGGAS